MEGRAAAATPSHPPDPAFLALLALASLVAARSSLAETSLTSPGGSHR